MNELFARGDRLFVERQITARLETIDLHPTGRACVWKRRRGRRALAHRLHGREVERSVGTGRKNKRALSAEIRKALAL